MVTLGHTHDTHLWIKTKNYECQQGLISVIVTLVCLLAPLVTVLRYSATLSMVFLHLGQGCTNRLRNYSSKAAARSDYEPKISLKDLMEPSAIPR